jgi:tryptophan synthase alpha chain
MGELLTDVFAESRATGRAALLPYLTAGLPDPESSTALFVAMAEAGADGFEVGIPYSDPLMDGPVIQEAGARALAAGANLERSIQIVASVATETSKPVIAMTYANPVLAMGREQFCARVAAAGGSGLIIADLPADEASPFLDAAHTAGLSMALFVAPTTDEARLQRIVELDPGFLYGIADLGVTGERAAASTRAAELAARVRRTTDLPLVLGVGISTPDQARLAGALADGVIVGTALVRRVLEAEDARAAASSLAGAVADLAAALGARH